MAMPSASMYAVHQQLVTIMKGIDGSGYHNNLDNQVSENVMEPDEGHSWATPYVCIPTVNPNVQYEHNENGSVTVTWRKVIFGYATEKADYGSGANEAIKVLEQLHDDILKALLSAGPRLNNTVDEWEALSCNIVAGTGENAFGFLEFTVSLSMIVATDNLLGV